MQGSRIPFPAGVCAVPQLRAAVWPCSSGYRVLRRANGVLGFKIDFDEISGKGVQMFMISVSGTAVKLRMEDKLSDVAEKYGLWVPAEKVNVELFKLNWKRRDNHLTPTKNELSFIMDHSLWELVPSLYEYFSEPNQTFDARPIDERFPIILSKAPKREKHATIIETTFIFLSFLYKVIFQ